MITIRDEVKIILQVKREQRRQKYLALFERFLLERPEENPRKLIAKVQGVSYWLVCDVLSGRR